MQNNVIMNSLSLLQFCLSRTLDCPDLDVDVKSPFTWLDYAAALLAVASACSVLACCS